MAKQSNTKRLALNTVYMYIRMFILMIISIYTSRVLLQQLGVEDYGIYNLVGSIVALFTSVRTFMTAPTQRFLNFEMGKGNAKRLNTIFNVSMLINLGISILFFILVEAVGLWFFEYKVNVDPTRLFAAKVVFQLSILTSLIGILTISYEAVVIANERFNFYAMISILEGGLKLGVIYLLSYSGIDKLIYYGVLILLSSIAVWLFYIIYCRIHFAETKLHRCWDKSLFKDMSKFAGWVFVGNMCYSFMHQGLNMMFNVFGGPLVNTARGIAYQVQSAISHFLGGVSRAMVPYSTKLFAQKDYNKYFRLIFISAKIQFIIFVCMALPCFTYAQEVLSLWLGQVPAYSVTFLQAVLIYGLVRSFQTPFYAIFDAANKLKGFEITNLSFMSISFLGAYLCMRLGYSFHYCFYLMAILEVLNFLTFNFVSMHTCGLPYNQMLKMVFMPIVFSFMVDGAICKLLASFACSNEIWWLWMPTSLLMAAVIVGVSFLICFTRDEKKMLLSIIKK